MPDAELRKAAEDLGIKKINIDQRQELVYNILDQQAINKAAEDAQKPVKPRRGRRPNAEKAAEDATRTDEKPAPKKRGRKKKSEIAAAQAAEAATGAAETTAQPTAQAPKQPNVEASDATPETAQPVTADTSETRPEEPAQQSTQQNNADNAQQEKTDDSFATFFPQFGGGRTFTPRSQREREADEQRRQQMPQQAPQPQQFYGRPVLTPEQSAANPITVGDPQPNTQVQPAPPGQGKKNKKNRNKNNANMGFVDSRFDFTDIIETCGVLEIESQGYGYLRSADYNYMPSPDDIYLTQQQIKQYALKTGDVVECTIRPPRENEKYFPLSQVLRVNGRTPRFIRDRIAFEHLTPLFPDEKFDLTSGKTCNLSTRVVDMFAPIGKGQRGLIVAPPQDR